MPLHAASTQSDEFKRPIESESERQAGVGDVEIDVPLPMIDSRL